MRRISFDGAIDMSLDDIAKKEAAKPKPWQGDGELDEPFWEDYSGQVYSLGKPMYASALSASKYFYGAAAWPTLTISAQVPIKIKNGEDNYLIWRDDDAFTVSCTENDFHQKVPISVLYHKGFVCDTTRTSGRIDGWSRVDVIHTAYDLAASGQ